MTSTLRAWWRAWRRREQAWRRRRGWAPVRDAELAARFRALWKVTPQTNPAPFARNVAPHYVASQIPGNTFASTRDARDLRPAALVFCHSWRYQVRISRLILAKASPRKHPVVRSPKYSQWDGRGELFEARRDIADRARGVKPELTLV